MAEPSPSAGRAAARLRYDAFISYSQRADIDLAARVQAGLQQLAKPWWRPPLLRVFRDKTSLAASPGVWSSIEASLAECRWFVLLASPSSAASVWVGKEVAWWLSHRQIDHLLLVVTDGDLVWDAARGDFDPTRSNCLPPPLAGCFREEPNFVDLRWARASDDLRLRHTRFRAAILDLAAPMHGRPKDEIDSDDIRQQRRTRHVSAAAVTTIAALGVGAAIAAWVAMQQADEARRQGALALSRQGAAEAQLAVREHRLQRAFDAALAGWAASPTQEARSALFEVWQAAQPLQHWVEGFDAIAALHWSADGRTLRVWQRSGRLSDWDLAAARVQRELRLALTDAPTASAFSVDGHRLAVGDAKGGVTVFDTASGTRLAQLQQPEGHEVMALAFHPSRPLLAAGYRFDPPGLVLWDLSRQAPAAAQPMRDPPSFALVYVTDLAFSADGRLLAATSGGSGSGTGIWLSDSGTLLDEVSSGGQSVMQSAVAFVDVDDTGAGGPATRLALGWSTGDASLHALSGPRPPRSDHPAHEDRVTRVVALRGGLLTTSADGVVHISNSLGTRRLPGWARAATHALAMDPGGARLATGGADGTLLVYGLQDAEPDPNHRPSIRRLANGRLLVASTLSPATASAPAASTSWIADGRSGAALVPPRRGATLISEDGRWTGVLVADGRLDLLDVEAAAPAWTTVVLPAGARPHGMQVQGSTVVLYASKPFGTLVARLDRPQQAARSPALAVPAPLLHPAPDGSVLLARSDRQVFMLDAVSLRQLGAPITLPPRPDDDDRDDLSWSPDSRWLLAGVAGRPLSLWRRDADGLVAPQLGAAAKRPAPLASSGMGAPVRSDPLVDARFSSDGHWLLAGDGVARWQVLDLRRGSVVFEASGKDLAALHLVPSSATLVLWQRDGRLQRLRLDDPAATPTDLPLDPSIGRASERVGSQGALVSTADGRWLVALGTEGSAVFDLVAASPGWALPGLGPPLALATGAPRAALGSDADHSAVVLDLDRQAMRRLTPAHARPLDDLAFTSDGALLASIDKHGNEAVWDASNARRISVLTRGSGEDEDLRHHLQKAPCCHRLGPPEPAFSRPMGVDAWVDSLCERGARAPAPAAAVEAAPASRASESSPTRIAAACRAVQAVRAALP